MTPAARLAAAAAILDSIAQGRQPADAVLKAWSQQNRYAGSRDRRAIAERVYQVLRARGRLSAFMGGRQDGRALVIGALSVLDGETLEEIEGLYNGEGYGPRPLSKHERGRVMAGEDAADLAEVALPDFVTADLKAVHGDRWREEVEALSGRAPVDLRVNGLRATMEEVEAELRDAGLSPQRTELSAWGLRLDAEPAPSVQPLDGFQNGHFEIQDEASQVVGWLSGAFPGATVVDYCAGGGGKTLGLVQAMQGQGALIACDVSAKRLDNVKPRLARAGVEADLRLLGANGGGVEDMNGQADVVLVDAPCSGSGAWRRRPEDIWRLTAEEVARLNALQVRILGQATKLVRPGGRLAYVTCSVLGAENEATAAAFEAAHSDFKPVPVADAAHSADLTEAGRERLTALAQESRLRLSPAATGTDGFFIALYERVS